MASKYIEVPREALEGWLQKHRFTPGAQGSEVVYERADSLYPGIVYRVYTSIPVSGDTARGCGQDAIRVVALARSKHGDVPLSKGVRVYRVTSVEGVLARLLERLGETSVAARDMASKVCSYCGGPAYTDSGRCLHRVCRGEKGR